MGQRVSGDTVIAADLSAVYDVIVDLPRYPEWAEDVERTEVLESDPDGLPLRASFRVDARIAMVNYTLRYQHQRPHRVRWSLVEGELLHQLDGEYVLTATDEGTHVEYALEAALAMPLPSFLQRRAARIIVDTGLQGLRRRVEEG
jgi:ribosome-associated toxin RatA of RatAB toxin-antitoxin module